MRVKLFVCGRVGAFVHSEGLEFPWNVGRVVEHVSATGQALTQGQRGISAVQGMWRSRHFSTGLQLRDSGSELMCHFLLENQAYYLLIACNPFHNGNLQQDMCLTGSVAESEGK